MNMRILIVEDEKNQRVLLKRILEKEGYDIVEAENGHQALIQFDGHDLDLVILDQRLPDMTGLDILKKFRAANPMIPVIIVTAYANVSDAVKAMRESAYYYVTKPVDAEELLLMIKKAAETMTLKRENLELKKSLHERYRYDRIIYTSALMEETMSMVSRAADSDANILITGESGTGKELIAGAVHNLSKRAKNLFVIAHLAALPETLVESELFGYVRGAFTGADKHRIGKFEFASGGTLFLDEIGELPVNVQAKLLRVIQEKNIVRLGANEEIKVDVRLICATNKNIEEELEKGNFREDLFYRLNVIRIHVPPLRERKEDISLLVDNFIRTYALREKKMIKGITDEAMKSIIRYDYPGNVRELGNIIERAAVLTRDEYIKKEDLPVSLFQRPQRIGSGKLKTVLHKLERNMIVQALNRCKGNQTKAARDLGVSERVLRYKIVKLNIKPI
ncbi:MAG: sigma-54 dependent transcriptional regulator [bacterium]